MTDQAVARVDLEIHHLSATICAELAAGLADAEGIRARYDLTPEQWVKLKSSPPFRQMLKSALKSLHGDLNADKRIKLKAQIALEDSIPVLYNIAHDAEVQPANKIGAIKEMKDMAGAGKGEAAGGPSGGGYNVNIVIKGREAEAVVIEQPTSTPRLVEQV